MFLASKTANYLNLSLDKAHVKSIRYSWQTDCLLFKSVFRLTVTLSFYAPATNEK